MTIGGIRDIIDVRRERVPKGEIQLAYMWGSESKSGTVHAFKTGGRLGMSEDEYRRSYKMRSVCGNGWADFKKFIQRKDGKRCKTCERHAK